MVLESNTKKLRALFLRSATLIFAIISGVCTISCSLDLSDAYQESDELKVDIIAISESAKTSLEGFSLSWVKNDRIGVYFTGIACNVPFICDGDNHFTGYVPLKKEDDAFSKDVYSYYPGCYQKGGYLGEPIVEASLPASQKAPFDPNADFMVSDKSRLEYDTEETPTVTLNFSNHLFSLIKLNITNSSDDLAKEKLVGVRVESNSNVLSGSFSFDVSLGEDAEATFLKTDGHTNHFVDVSYPTPEVFGKNKVHSLYVVVPAGDYPSGDITVSVFIGDDRKGTITSKCDMTFERGNIHELQSIDVASLELVKRFKTVLCFGDSITTRTVTDCLQSLLGMDWKVYLAGVTGESVRMIMGRAGATPLFVEGGFSIPASSKEIIGIGTSFWSNLQDNGNISETPDIAVNVNLAAYSETDKSLYCGLANPFMVNGVECTISSSDGKLFLQRIEDGESVLCPGPYTQVVPYSKWKLGNPTITTCYMGTNGSYAANAATGRTKNQVLADMYRMVKNGTTGGFIAIGYHHGFWNTAFRDTFYEELGDNYLDLRTYGCHYAETIAAREGYALSIYDFENISNNIWPSTWGGLEIHPYEPVGARAHAYCIYFKMKELGYLDE